MELPVKFVGGPMAGVKAMVEGLDEMRVFYDDGKREIVIYRRDPCIDELSYLFDRDLSAEATAKYDEAKAFYWDMKYSPLRFVED